MLTSELFVAVLVALYLPCSCLTTLEHDENVTEKMTLTTLKSTTVKSENEQGKKVLLVLAMVDLGQDPSCESVTNDLKNFETIQSFGQQRLQIIRWTLERIQSSSNLTTDFQILDTCGNSSFAAQTLISFAANYQLIRKPNVEKKSLHDENFCEDTQVNGGFLLSSALNFDIFDRVRGVAPGLPLYMTPADDMTQLMMATTALVHRLGWLEAFIISDDEKFANQFGKFLGRQNNLCITENVILQNETEIDAKLENLSSGVNTVFIFGRSKKFLQSLVVSSRLKSLTWIMATEGEMNWHQANMSEITFSVKEVSGYNIQLSFHHAPEFIRQYKMNHLSTNQSTWEDPHSLEIMKLLMSMSQSSSRCPDSTRIDDFETRYKLGLSYEPEKFTITALKRNHEGNFRSLKIGTYTPKNGLELNISLTSVLLKTKFVDQMNHDYTCINLSPMELPPDVLRWRFDTWVSVFITVAAVGMVITACIAVYIFTKSCTEVLDGSQVFSLLLLFTLMLMYTALVPYSLAANATVCAIRSASTRLVYTVTFGVMCARSIMLATADSDGLPGHVSGWVQFALFIFIAGVQIAILIQEWFTKELKSYVQPHYIPGSGLKCHDSGRKFIFSLSYVMILLVFQIFLSPLIVKSQRNYREGLLFSISSIACIFVWIGWVTTYLIISDWVNSQTADIAICTGLVVTATFINLIVFLPKCYLMSTPTVYKSQGLRDTANQFRALDFTEAFSTSNSRLSEALNVHGTTTTCSTTDDILLMEGQHQNSSLHTDLYGSFKESHFQPVVRRSHRPTIHMVDSPTLEMDQNYPTYKLDRNTVVDNSIRWERYSYPSASRQPDSVSSGRPQLPHSQSDGTRL